MLKVRSLSKTFIGHDGEDVRAVDEVQFSVEEGRIFTLLGPSGCGKTTTLRCVAGLERPHAGTILVGDEHMFSDVQRIFVPPHKRPVGMVFQSYAIWPHMTVFKNVAYPLESRGSQVGAYLRSHGKRRLTRKEIKERVERALATVRLDGLEGRSATKLSGGQQQRLALARAIVDEPRVLLLDEPLSNLDAKLRDEMRAELKELQRRLKLTSLYVTHDQVEALGLSDVVAVMNRGQIQQVGKPRQIYEQPATTFVAQFVGSTNWLEGEAQGGTRTESGRVELVTPFGVLTCVTFQPLAAAQTVTASIRPEYVTVSTGEASPENSFKATVSKVTFLGEYVDCWLELAGDVTVRARLHPSNVLRRGHKVFVTLPADRCVVLRD